MLATAVTRLQAPVQGLLAVAGPRSRGLSLLKSRALLSTVVSSSVSSKRRARPPGGSRSGRETAPPRDPSAAVPAGEDPHLGGAELVDRALPSGWSKRRKTITASGARSTVCTWSRRVSGDGKPRRRLRLAPLEAVISGRGWDPVGLKHSHLSSSRPPLWFSRSSPLKASSMRLQPRSCW